MSDILLHGAGGFPFVRKFRIVLAECSDCPRDRPAARAALPGDHT